MKFKKFISLITAAALSAGLVTATPQAADTEVYTCDFTQLVKDSADTYYGSESDTYALDDYTTAVLTYDGTYVSADAKVYLKGGTATNSAAKVFSNSYIAFTAPSDGTVTAAGADIGFVIDSTYQGYGASGTYELEKGQVFYMGYRKGSTYVSALTFTPSEADEPSPSPTTDTSGSTERGTLLYSEDFEDYSDGDTAGWISPAGTMAVASDSTSGIGKYQTVTSNKSGTCRSGYITLPSAVSTSFVFECDYKSTSNVNVSDLELLENKNSIYANHGRYSTANYAFTMARPMNSDLYVINNGSDDSGLTLDKYTDPVFSSAEISGNPWLHVKVIGDLENHTAVAYITSLDGSTVYYHGMTDMSADLTSWSCMHILSPSTDAPTCIDNIAIYEATEADLSEAFYTVTIDDGMTTFSQYVYTGESVVNIPDVSVCGEYFLGWAVNGNTSTLYSSAELSAYAITSDAAITAVISDDYIEGLGAVEFNAFPTGNLLTMGADGDTYADNEISLTITGERGTSIVTNADSRVSDYTIDWQFDGFRILGGTSTGEDGAFPGTQTYCDSYASVTVSTVADTSVDFKLKKTYANYYGLATATVTYNGTTISVSEPLLLLGDTSSDNVIFPSAGYTSDYNDYDSALVGYSAGSGDILIGGWQTYGSDSTRMTLGSDSTGQFLSLSRAASGNSSAVYAEIGALTNQTVFEQDMRFGINGSVSFIGGGTVTAPSATAFTLSYSSGAFTFNGETVCSAASDTWYHIVISAAADTENCTAKIYELRTDGDYSTATPIGETDVVSFTTTGSTETIYRISPAKSSAGSIDINNVKIYKTTTNESDISVTAPTSIAIPASGTTTASISASAVTTDGDEVISAAQWSIPDTSISGVTIESDGDRSAVITVDASAPSGDVPVTVTINGAATTVYIRLTGTAENVAFTSLSAGVQIPADGSASYTYTAEVRDGNGDTVSGRTVTYALYDSDNANLLTATGITLSVDGVLTVMASAAPQTVYIRATSVNSSGTAIERSAAVSVYSLDFDFGTDTADGKTAANRTYSESLGYGLTGTYETGESSVTGTDFVFKVQLENGNVYEVTAVYDGTILCEYTNSSLNGFMRINTTLTTDTYNTAVFGDGVLDITFSGTGELSSISIEKVERTANTLPAWLTIGDSTVQQNGSWGYTIVGSSASSTTSLSSYPYLDGTISAFYDTGKAGTTHRTYYTQGYFNALLCYIKPGDVVSISGMGTNDTSATKDEFASYDNAFIDAIEDMGATVILGSYTPTGNYGATEGKVYDADSVLFKGLRTGDYDLAIREVYAERVAAGDENILGFVDIGQIADNLMTNDVRKSYNAVITSGGTASAAREAANTRAEELMAIWKDYNHYYTSFSNYILPTITKHFAQLIKGEAQDDVPAVISLLTSDAEETATPTAEPTTGVTITSSQVTSTSVSVTIAAGFEGTLLAAMYESDGTLIKLYVITDNTSAQTITFERDGGFADCTLKLMLWDSLAGMTPCGDAQVYSVDDLAATPTAAPTTAATATPTVAPTETPTAEPTETPTVSAFEITSSDEYIDVSGLTTYGGTSYRIYAADGSYESVTAADGKVHNTTGGEATVVAEFKLEFTNQTSPTDEHIAGYTKVGESSYTSESGYGLSGTGYSINANGCLPTSSTGSIKLDLEAGFYDITLYRLGGGRADVYCDGVMIMNNTTSTTSLNRGGSSALMYAPAVDITDGTADITIGDTSGSNERVASIEVVRVPEKYRKPVIWIAGDSEAANYFPIDADGDDLASDKIMITGFGMQLDKFLSDDYAINNWGQPSATAGTWNTECLEAISARMCSGDTILIDFGINDAISSSNKVDSDTALANIQLIIDAANAAGATPILISPVYNGKYQSKAYFTYDSAADSNDLAEYAESVGVDFIDLNKYTYLYTQQAISETGDTSWVTNNYHVNDNLHLTQHSALLAASFICAGLNALGYDVTDYAYTYSDISDLDTDAYTRGSESGVTRVYSVAEAADFIKANTAAEPDYTLEWTFDTEDEVATSGTNIPVLGGTAVWSEDYQNVKFDATTTTAGTLDLTLDPALDYGTVSVDFDLNVSRLGGQYFTYEIADSEGSNLVYCTFEIYNALGYISVAGTQIAATSDFKDYVSCIAGDGMSASTTHFSNVIDFDNNTVTIKIGSYSVTGALTGAESGAVANVSFTSSRSKTADRSIYLDNLSLQCYASDGGSSDTAFEDFQAGILSLDGTEIPYRYRLPDGYSTQKKYPVVIFLHGDTRAGEDNEKQLYNAQAVFDTIIDAYEDCILIAPQRSSDMSWTDDNILAVLATAAQNFAADSTRIYLGGYGSGADACYALMGEYPNTYAAAFTVAGEGDTSYASAIAAYDPTILAFNGADADTNAREMIKAINAAGGSNTYYTEYYGEGENVLSSAAEMSGALDKLFSAKLNSNTNDKVVDLAIFMGQSNMAGRGEWADATEVALGHGYEFRSVTEADMLFSISGPFGKFENNDTINDAGSNGVDRRTGDMVSSIMESYYNETGVPIVGVQCSRGGTDTSYWNTSAQKAEAQARLTAAKEYLEDNGYTINHIFMVWCQGEADADKIYSGSRSVDTYKSNTLSVFSYMQDAGVTDMFIVQTGHYNGSDDTDGTHDEAYVSVHDAQAELAADNDNIYVVGSFLEYQEYMKDSYHFYQTAYNAVGTAAGAAIAGVLE